MKLKPGVLLSRKVGKCYIYYALKEFVGKQRPQCDTWELSICGTFCTTLFWRCQRLYANYGNEMEEEWPLINR